MYINTFAQYTQKIELKSIFLWGVYHFNRQMVQKPSLFECTFRPYFILGSRDSTNIIKVGLFTFFEEPDPLSANSDIDGFVNADGVDVSFLESVNLKARAITTIYDLIPIEDNGIEYVPNMTMSQALNYSSIIPGDTIVTKRTEFIKLDFTLDATKLNVTPEIKIGDEKFSIRQDSLEIILSYIFSEDF